MIIKLFNEKKEKPDFKNIGFGEVFSDYMIEMNYDNGEWGDIIIKKYESMLIEPSNCAWHYGQSCFEGMKAFIGSEDDKIRLFRPNENLNRLNQTHDRICIPLIPNEKLYDILDALEIMLKLDKEWIPPEKGALYIRPFTVAMENFIGIRPANKYKFMIITSPVPEYFPEGFTPIRLWVPEKFTRAVIGGVGEAKVAGNYTAGMLPQKIAATMKCQQVLFLRDNKYITECNAMNIFFVIDGVIITPALDGTILHGITRKSIIDYAQMRGFETEVRVLSIDELMDAAMYDSLDEVFICGTAAVVIPVNEIIFGEHVIKTNWNVGPFTKDIYEYFLDLQYGRIDHKWIHIIE